MTDFVTVFPGDYAKELAQQFPVNKIIIPHRPVWFVVDGVPIQELVWRLRKADGPVEEYDAEVVDYIDTVSMGHYYTELGYRHTRTATYVFGRGPKPQLVELEDDYGKYHQWVQLPTWKEYATCSE